MYNIRTNFISYNFVYISFQLFSSFVQIEPQYLPEEAKLIHEECKGAFCVVVI